MQNENEKSTLELIQEEIAVEQNPYFDEQTGLDFTPDDLVGYNPREESSEDNSDEELDEDYFESFSNDSEDDSEDDSFTYEEDEEFELLSLDPTLAENPVLLKRAQEYEKGVKKLINRVKEKEERLNVDDEQVSVLRQWNDVLSNPDTVAPGLKHLVQEICRINNLDPYDVFLDTISESNTNTQYEPDINNLVEQKVQERLKEYEDDLKYFKGKKEKEETEQALKQYIDTVATKTISIIKKNDQGWEITEDMIKEAVTALPNLLSNPVKAVRSYFSDERINHYQKANRSKGTAPNLTTQSSIGRNLPDDPLKVKAIDIMRMLDN